MRRKVIQIAGSTQLVSLPRQWCQRNNLKKGQEIEVEEDGSKVVISASSTPLVETAELDITNMEDMTARCIHALYKRGVDELRITFKEPSKIRLVQEAIGKEAVGFEILEQNDNQCIIRYVSGNLEGFDSILRRTFLLLLTMSHQSYEFLRDGNYGSLQNTAFLEEANNRFTTICRRYLNKNGGEIEGKVGPLYYIVEELEKIADQYKYLCQHYTRLKGKKVTIDRGAIRLFEKTDGMLRNFYEVFYKFDPEKINGLKAARDQIVDDAHKLFQKDLNYADYWLIYHSLAISTKIFGMSGPLVLLKL